MLENLKHVRPVGASMHERPPDGVTAEALEREGRAGREGQHGKEGEG